MGIDINSSVDLLRRGSSEKESRTCEWPGCKEPGLWRAPKSREELTTFRWFCKIHIRQYNLAWNYYSGMTDEEVENDVRRDTTWQRPSWKLGTLNKKSGQFSSENLYDPLNILGKKSYSGKSEKYSEEIKKLLSLSQEQKSALNIFKLSFPLTEKKIKTRYKKLVKLYHPDANGNIAAKDSFLSQEKIKDINQAYQILLKMLT